MSNDLTVARCVASELDRGDWLRFVTTGNLPGKPNGSAVVYVTRSVVGVAQLTENLRSRPVIRLPLIDLGVDRTDRHRLWRRVTDLELTSGDRTVRVEGIFGEEADEFLDTVDRRAGELGCDSRPWPVASGSGGGRAWPGHRAEHRASVSARRPGPLRDEGVAGRGEAPSIVEDVAAASAASSSRAVGLQRAAALVGGPGGALALQQRRVVGAGREPRRVLQHRLLERGRRAGQRFVDQPDPYRLRATSTGSHRPVSDSARCAPTRRGST